MWRGYVPGEPRTPAIGNAPGFKAKRRYKIATPCNQLINKDIPAI